MAGIERYRKTRILPWQANHDDDDPIDRIPLPFSTETNYSYHHSTQSAVFVRHFQIFEGFYGVLLESI